MHEEIHWKNARQRRAWRLSALVSYLAHCNAVCSAYAEQSSNYVSFFSRMLILFTLASPSSSRLLPLFSSVALLWLVVMAFAEGEETPDEIYDDSHCVLLGGTFSLCVQAFLFVISFFSLVVKRKYEEPKRPGK
jgi:hypothetical protein